MENKKITILKKFIHYHNYYYKKILENNSIDKNKIKVIETFLKEVIEQNDFCLRVSYESLNKIIIDNYVKNILETHKGATIGGEKTRIKVIEELYNINFNEISKTDIPKYGYIGPKNKLVDIVKNADLDYQYGSIILTLKKENLINRTTMTIGDSINMGDFFNKLPTFVNDPKIVCLKGKLIDGEKNNILKSKPLIYYINKFYDLIKSNTLIPTKPFLLQESFNEIGFEFFELQYFGEIIFDRDIERIDYYSSNKAEEKKMQEIIPKCKEKNIPINEITFEI